ncbi:YqfQ-like protein [Thalassobacillus cyri]|uniref:YqfQ-like protein n=1 Tax=Thalassobacillus cyri TaxID=571932 RepID=A0A1H4CTP5_9BACI|nr:VrrA/YqfQ family protein [Thalassobacillus cyri]SEA63813.1 YqfQ-like protein [Thalassobacillus cyri]
MFPPARPPMGGRPPGFGGQSPFQIGSYGNQFGVGNQFGGVPQKQGFLSKLLAKRGAGATARGVGGAVQGGGTDFASMLGNAQQVLKMAQSAAPMIQQYGPMMKNIPTLINLWKIMREPDEDTETQTESNSGSPERMESRVSSNRESNRRRDESPGGIRSNVASRANQGTSQPKLYI